MTGDGGSRRSRTVKPPLSREWIIAETIKIMSAEGLAKATMRRVAKELDTGPASLYVYVSSTAELHAAVLDQLIADLPDSDGFWRDRVERLLAAYSEVLVAHPGLARSALVLRPTGPNSLALFDRLLGLLLEGGIAPARATWGVDLLLQQVTASAAEHSAASPGDLDSPSPAAIQNALDSTVRQADAARLPHVAAHATDVLSGTPDERRRWSIDVLLAGIASTPVPTEPNAATA